MFSGRVAMHRKKEERDCDSAKARIDRKRREKGVGNKK